jgi:hypothetical protein
MSAETKLLARKKIEASIEEGLLRAYAGLYKIWEQKLYAIDFKSFEDYLNVVWGYSKGQGYRLIGYVEFISASNVPNLERHLREGAYRYLHRLATADQKQQAVKILQSHIATGTRITHHTTQQIARQIAPEPSNPGNDAPADPERQKLGALVEDVTDTIEKALNEAYEIRHLEQLPTHVVINSFLRMITASERLLVECFGAPAEEARVLAKAYVAEKIKTEPAKAKAE